MAGEQRCFVSMLRGYVGIELHSHGSSVFWPGTVALWHTPCLAAKHSDSLAACRASICPTDKTQKRLHSNVRKLHPLNPSDSLEGCTCSGFQQWQKTDKIHLRFGDEVSKVDSGRID